VLIVLLSAGLLAAGATWWRARLPQGPLERLMQLPRPVAVGVEAVRAPLSRVSTLR
jgi:hypothetical protein